MYKIHVNILEDKYNYLDKLDEFDYISSILPIKEDILMKGMERYIVIERILMYDNPHFVILYVNKY